MEAFSYYSEHFVIGIALESLATCLLNLYYWQLVEVDLRLHVGDSITASTGLTADFRVTTASMLFKSPCSYGDARQLELNHEYVTFAQERRKTVL